MPRRALRYGFDLLLLAAAVVTFLTGVLVDNLDLNQFAPHRWAGYVLASLVLVHVALHWRFFLAPSRSRPHRPAMRTDVLPEGAPPTELGQAPVGTTRRTALTAAGAGILGVTTGWFAKSALTPVSYAGGDPGAFYHRASSLGLPSLLRGLINWGGRPAPYKRVPGATVVLSGDQPLPDLPVGQALAQRRSLRSYRDRPLTAQELAWLVHAASAITSGNGYRTAPSAGALYPIEAYVAVTRVRGVPTGLYHVDVRAQALELVHSEPVAGDLMLAGLGQEFLRTAPVVLVLTGVFQRTRWKYRERHYRYVLWEGGHIAQNVYLAAEAAGLGACMVGAFFDRSLNDVLRIDGRHEAALGLIAVGAR
jgi:SagB-type dehydrogenase family enzyme